MKRASLLAVSLGAMAAGLFGAGCKTQAEYDKVYGAWQRCDGERNEQRMQISALTAELDVLKKERTAWEADKTALMDRINGMKTEYDKLAATNADLVRQLQARPAPVININPPGPLPRVLSEKLKEFAAKNPGLVTYDEASGLVRFSADLLFDLGSFEVKAEVVKQLSDFAEIVNIDEAKQFDVLVVGHTDNVRIARAATRERTPTNWHLSVYRAVSVLEALARARVDAKRLGAMGFGEERPRVPNRQGGTKENRRVEVFLVPKGNLAVSSAAPLVLPGAEVMAALGR